MNRLNPAISVRFCVRATVIAVFAFLTAALPACRHQADVRLERISQYVGNEPEKALAALDSIDYSSLSIPDRHFFDFLSIKAKDKAYVVHTSDSLVLDVIRWYEADPEYGLYPDALYYGGRVYCDLGDQPTALRYFQQALDLLPENTENRLLRASVVSQTAQLLDRLRLYKEAIPYIKESIKMDSMLNDTLNELYDLHLLGLTEIQDSNYMEAVKAFRVALAKSKEYSKEMHTKSRMYLGAAKYHVGDMDSALLLVRNIPDSLPYLDQNTALAYAARIYQRAGFPDTALYYAERLIHHPIDINKTVAYQILLSPELSGVVCQDSLLSYAREYSSLINQEWNENSNHLALDRQNIYNYDIHERERKKAEADNQKLIVVIFAILSLVMILTIIILYLKNRNQSQCLELRDAIDNVFRLRQRLNEVEKKSDDSHAGKPSEDAKDKAMADDSVNLPVVSSPNTAQLREELKDALYSLYMDQPQAVLSQVIMESSVYDELQDKINQVRPLQDTDPFWEELERIVLQASPEFKSNLRLLTRGRLSAIDLHTALLIKCHIAPSHMSILLGRTRSTIATRRQSLCLKIFDQKMDMEVIDGVIKLL